MFRNERATAVADIQFAQRSLHTTDKCVSGEQQGNEAIADCAEYARLDRHRPEHQVRLLKHLRRYCPALLIVTVQQRDMRPPLYDEGEFPGEIVCVLNARIHPLPTGRAVDVRGIAGEEGMTDAETCYLPVVQAKGGKPKRIAQCRACWADVVHQCLHIRQCRGSRGGSLSLAPPGDQR